MSDNPGITIPWEMAVHMCKIQLRYWLVHSKGYDAETACETVEAYKKQYCPVVHEQISKCLKLCAPPRVRNFEEWLEQLKDTASTDILRMVEHMLHYKYIEPGKLVAPPVVLDMFDLEKLKYYVNRYDHLIDNLGHAWKIQEVAVLISKRPDSP